jgi:hypothetical protein
MSSRLEGDWTVIEGTFFPEFSYERHVVRPFPVPTNWMRFASIDWGSAKPFSVGWWAVVSDAYATTDGHTLPRGAWCSTASGTAPCGPTSASS